MTTALPDIIDQLAGIDAGSALAGLRDQRPEARENAQKSYLALFHAAETGEASLLERHAVAAFVAGLHRDDGMVRFYAGGLAENGGGELGALVAAEVERGLTQGPYGHFPAGRLTPENTDGLGYKVQDVHRERLGARLSAALEHAHMLVFHPRDADAPALQALLDAGWSTTGIVTLSQLVTFLAFQIRVVAGLRVLKAA